MRQLFPKAWVILLLIPLLTCFAGCGMLRGKTATETTGGSGSSGGSSGSSGSSGGSGSSGNSGNPGNAEPATEIHISGEMPRIP